MHVIKFSSEDCGTCHRMSHYDAKVAGELGAEFVSVMLPLWLAASSNACVPWRHHQRNGDAIPIQQLR